MVDASNPENGVELVLIVQSVMDGSPQRSPRKSPRKRGDTTRRHFGSNNPKGSMDMNQEFPDNYGFVGNLDTDPFDT